MLGTMGPFVRKVEIGNEDLLTYKHTNNIGENTQVIIVWVYTD